MKYSLVILPIFGIICSCSSEPTTTEVEDTAPPDTGWPDVAITVQDMNFELTDDGMSLSLTTSGWATEVIFNAYNTSVSNPTVNGWDEEHFPKSTGQTTKDDPLGVTDSRSISLEHVESIIYYKSNESTLYNSDNNGDITYAVRVYGDNGELAQCLVWGHSIGSLYGGNYSSVNITSYPEQFNPTQCEEWTPTDTPQ